MEERGLKISRRKTEYLGCNEHQDAELHLEGDRVKTFTYLGSTMEEDGELDVEDTHIVQSGGRSPSLPASLPPCLPLPPLPPSLPSLPPSLPHITLFVWKIV